MLLLLPLVCFLLLFEALRRTHRDTDPRSAFLSAVVVLGVIATAITELLSLFRSLSAPGVALGWFVATGGAALIAARQARLRKPPPPPAFGSPSRLGLALGLPIVAIALLTGLIALLGWPNEGDSFSYHLSRVAHWAQNRSVDHYPTNILHQLYYPPWAEFAILHLDVLGWDERLKNLVQWFSMLGSVVGVSLIARRLGANPRGQLFSAFFCATLPIGILQASTTQNDYVAAFWLVCLFHALLAWRDQPTSIGRGLEVGASLGLALLTKSTAYIYAAPSLLLLLPGRRPSQWAGSLERLALVGLVALALNAPHYARNFELFGSVIGPVTLGPSGALGEPLRQTNEVVSLPILASNLVRNTVLHFGTPFPAVNAALRDAVTAWHTRLGIDVNDPRTTWQAPALQFVIPQAPADESSAGNPVHLLLIFGSVLAVTVSRRWRENLYAGRYVLSLALTFVLLSLVLKWQQFHGHWQLPLFVLWSPVVGVALQGHVRLVAGAVVLMLVCGAPFVLYGQAHPLVGKRSLFTTDRLEQTFRYRPHVGAMYLGAADVVRLSECAEVGLLLRSNGLEYPFWLMLPEIRAGRGRLEHVAVANRSEQLASRWPAFTPCAVAAMHGPSADTLEIGGRVYQRAWSGEAIAVFLDGGQMPARTSGS